MMRYHDRIDINSNITMTEKEMAFKFCKNVVSLSE